jgi:hypothetical protein
MVVVLIALIGFPRTSSQRNRRIGNLNIVSFRIIILEMKSSKEFTAPDLGPMI